MITGTPVLVETGGYLNYVSTCQLGDRTRRGSAFRPFRICLRHSRHFILPLETLAFHCPLTTGQLFPRAQQLVTFSLLLLLLLALLLLLLLLRLLVLLLTLMFLLLLALLVLLLLPLLLPVGLLLLL